jgi:hypothetical protein
MDLGWIFSTHVLSTYVNIEITEGLYIQTDPGIDSEDQIQLYQNPQDIWKRETQHSRASRNIEITKWHNNSKITQQTPHLRLQKP